MAVQLTLRVELNSHTQFDNYFAGDNEPIKQYLHEAVCGQHERQIYLTGAVGTGRTHLLQACCHLAFEQGKQAVYLPLAEALAPELLEDIENMDVICIDDIDHVAGQQQWEHALFHCLNRLQLTNSLLVVTSALPPQQIDWLLPDLASRFAQQTVLTLHALSDEEKLSALLLRAKERGLSLPVEVGHYLLRHYRRDCNALFAALEKLANKSLELQRRLTIPFVKEILVS